MFGLIKKMFIGLLISIVNASNHTKRVSLTNQVVSNRLTWCTSKETGSKEISKNLYYETFFAYF